MAIKEIFAKPTVKQVIFQITFPNLFSIENKVGEFQTKIMKEFPESALIFQRQLFFTDIGDKEKLKDIEDYSDKQGTLKIWRFKSKKKCTMNVSSNSLNINSEHHKTYDLEGGTKFKDIIKFTVDCFLEITKIPIINRIGLRYINECPIPARDNEKFKSYYNTVFPLDRFNLADANEMLYKTEVRKENYNLRYIESFKKKGKKYQFILDFDASAEKISSKNYLKTTDKLHEIVNNEYGITIKEPLKKYMREGKEVS